MLRWVFATILFFLVAVELLFFAPDAGDRRTQSGVSAGNETPSTPVPSETHEQVLAGGYLVESQGEAKSWELWSKVARKKKGSEDWELDKVKVQFYGKGDVVYVANGKMGTVTENQKKLRIQGDVTVRSNNGYLLETSVIEYEAKSRIMSGQKVVDLKGPKGKGEEGPLYLKGQSFKADLNTNIIRMFGGVKGRKKMSHKRKMKISSRRAIFSGRTNMVRFEKNVIMKTKSLRVSGPRAQFLYRNGELDRLSVTGGVNLADLDKWGVAGRADVFFREDKYVFQGDPKVVQGEDELIGDKIIMFDGGERIQVFKARAKYKPKEDEKG